MKTSCSNCNVFIDVIWQKKGVKILAIFQHNSLNASVTVWACMCNLTHDMDKKRPISYIYFFLYLDFLWLSFKTLQFWLSRAYLLSGACEVSVTILSQVIKDAHQGFIFGLLGLDQSSHGHGQTWHHSAWVTRACLLPFMSGETADKTPSSIASRKQLNSLLVWTSLSPAPVQIISEQQSTFSPLNCYNYISLVNALSGCQTLKMQLTFTFMQIG